MIYDYYSHVGGTGLGFYCIVDSEQRPEIGTKRLMIPAASMAKVVEALSLYAM